MFFIQSLSKGLANPFICCISCGLLLFSGKKELWNCSQPSLFFMCTSDFSPASVSPISSSLLPPPVRVRCVCSPGLLCSSFLTVYFSMSIYLRNPCTSDTRIHLSANLQHISRQVFLSSWYFCLKYQVLYSQRMSSPPLTMATSVMHAHHLPPSVILGPGFSR